MLILRDQTREPKLKTRTSCPTHLTTLGTTRRAFRPLTPARPPDRGTAATLNFYVNRSSGEQTTGTLHGQLAAQGNQAEGAEERREAEERQGAAADPRVPEVETSKVRAQASSREIKTLEQTPAHTTNPEPGISPCPLRLPEPATTGHAAPAQNPGSQFWNTGPTGFGAGSFSNNNMGPPPGFGTYAGQITIQSERMDWHLP